MRAVTLHLHQETHRDILVSRDGDAETALWLRKDHIEFTPTGAGRVDCLVPNWLAKERGLVP